MTRAEAIQIIQQYASRLEELELDHPYDRKLRQKVQDLAERIESEDKGDGGKAMRWLGYVQGRIEAAGLATVDEMKEHSRSRIVGRLRADEERTRALAELYRRPIEV